MVLLKLLNMKSVLLISADAFGFTSMTDVASDTEFESDIVNPFETINVQHQYGLPVMPLPINFVLVLVHGLTPLV